MKMSKMIKSAAVLLIPLVAGATALANPQQYERVAPGERYVYVWVTGSKIPQKVKISPIGTTAFNAMSVWDRRQINQTGRGTAEDVLRQDPSISVISGHGGPGW